MGTATRTYDANGNTTGRSAAGTVWGYGYDGRNRMTAVTQNGTTVGTYVYNAMNERVSKSHGSTTTRFVYDEASQLVSEVSGSTRRDYVAVAGIPLAVADGSSLGFVTADGLGSPRAVTSSTGAVVWNWPYATNPFGENRPVSSTGYVLNLRLPGQYADGEAGLKYNLNRTFDTATGRYLQSDPLGLAGGMSTYAYVSGSPLTWADVLGLDQSLGYRTIKGGSKSGIWQIQCQLSEPSQNPGYVVQTVTGVTPDGQTVVYSEAWEVGTGDVNTMVSQTRQIDDTFVGWKSLHAEATYYDGLELPDSYTYGGGKYAHDLLSKPGGADITGCRGSNTVMREFTPPANVKP